jgi:hypothetical protein
MAEPVTLSPTQRAACEAVVAALPVGRVFELRSKTGRGRTTVLSALHTALGGSLLTVKDFVAALDKRHPLALEEVLFERIYDALI